MWEHTHDQLTSEPTLDICPSTHFMNPTYLTDIPRIYHAKTDRKACTYIEHTDKHGGHAAGNVAGRRSSRMRMRESARERERRPMRSPCRRSSRM